MRRLGAWGTFVALAATVGARAADLPLRQITVDATFAVGTLRPFSGVQAVDGEGSALYRAARVDLVRIHDPAGVATIDAIFPDINADANDPKNYRFAAVDRLVAAIKSAGAEPLFGLAGGLGGVGGAAPTAPDADKWALIVRHIVLHYSAGWNKGSRNQVRYWEVWDAPDSDRSWRGSAQQYYVLYAKAAQAIQGADGSALVGGPGLSKPLITGAYREKFFDFVRMNRLPLDFFSWHFRSVDSNDPYVFVSIARQLRAILDAHGFGSTRSILDEWGPDPREDLLKPERGAFAGSALIYMLGGPIDSQIYETGAQDVGGLLAAFGSMRSTPQLLRTTGGDESGFALLAARSEDKRLLQILISNYQVPAKFSSPRNNWDTSLPERRTLQYQDNGGYDAAITVLGSGKYQVKRYLMNDAANFTLMDQSVQTGPNLHVQAALAPPAVELIVISAK